MFCPSCGNEITVELKYCNRCGANLTLTHDSSPTTVVAPVKLLAPTLVLGLTVLIGLGIIIGGATSLAEKNVHPCVHHLDGAFQHADPVRKHCHAVALLVKNSKFAKANSCASTAESKCNTSDLRSATIAASL